MMRVEILVFEVATYTESSDATSSNLVKYEQGVAFYRYESRGKLQVDWPLGLITDWTFSHVTPSEIELKTIAMLFCSHGFPRTWLTCNILRRLLFPYNLPSWTIDFTKDLYFSTKEQWKRTVRISYRQKRINDMWKVYSLKSFETISSSWNIIISKCTSFYSAVNPLTPWSNLSFSLLPTIQFL